MTNYANMSLAFEREKNVKAASYTFLLCTILFLIFFYFKWTLPVIPLPPIEEGIEVNLGNSDEGLGDIAPQVPGDPALAKQESYSPQKSSAPTPQEQNITGDENEIDEAAPVVNNVTKPIIKKDIVKDLPPTKVVNNNPQPVAPPTPAPPKPKAVYAGGTTNGTGGNGADTYNNVRNQGIAGGNGDQGSPNGNPNSDSYSGSGGNGNSGVRISKGLAKRRITKLPSFQDDFNENAKVAVDIKVDINGNVISATVNPRGTTTTNATIRAIAIKKAMQLKLNAGEEDDQTGTILFDFKLRG